MGGASSDRRAKFSLRFGTCLILEESLVTLEKKAEKRKTGSDYHSFERDVSLSHSQRDLVAQEVGVMHQVSYSSSVSTFCRLAR